MESIFDYFYWLGSNSEAEKNIELSKHEIVLMKDADDVNSKKILQDQNYIPEVLDRKILMQFEKQFREKFKKIGNLNQKCPHCAQEYKSLHVGEKKCLNCKKSFVVQKRVQDMATVAFKVEEQVAFDLHWSVVSSAKKFKFYLKNEYDYVQKQLEKQGKRNLKHNDIMYALLDAYAKNALCVGHYALYAKFIFYKAELLRSEQRFAEALVHYFYIYFLHNNGVDNSANFSVNSGINEELKERIVELLNLGNLQVKKIQGLFNYAIGLLNKFNEEALEVSQYKSYSLLMKIFKELDAHKDTHKPMRSFVLYTKAS
jgi:uncharacterized protein with PIN domain